MASKAIENAIPYDQEFHAMDIANKLYPNSVKYDTEGRSFNRAISAVVRMLRSVKGIQEIGHCRFYAHIEYFVEKHMSEELKQRTILFKNELRGANKSITTVIHEYELDIPEIRVKGLLQEDGFWVCNRCYEWADLPDNGSCEPCNKNFAHGSSVSSEIKR